MKELDNGMFLHESDGEYGLSQFKNLHPNDLYDYNRHEKEYQKKKGVWHSLKEIEEIIA